MSLIEVQQAQQNPDAEPDGEHSEATSDMSISSLDSETMALLPAAASGPREPGGYGLRGIHGRHGEPQRQAIEQILPVLREHLKQPGALALGEKQNVQIALDLASKKGLACWGPNQVYKSKRNVQNAILNLYFQSVVASLHN